MTRETIAPESETLVSANAADTLTSEERMLAYLRAAMLEFGDNPDKMAVAISNVEIARARLQRKDPLRAAATVVELKRPAAKPSR